MLAAFLAYVLGPYLVGELGLLIAFVVLLNLRSLIRAAIDRLP